MNKTTYRIEQLEDGAWITKERFSHRQTAFQRIREISREVTESNGNSVDGPHFILSTGYGKHYKIIA